jgi:copper chaperone CopZ
MALGMMVAVSILAVGGCATTGSSGGGGDSHGASVKGTTAASLLNDTTVVKGTSSTMLVWGMSCPLCAKNVDIELRRIKGVATVEADLGEGFVYVTLDGSAPVTRGQLARAVNDSGFTIKSFQN